MADDDTIYILSFTYFFLVCFRLILYNCLRAFCSFYYCVYNIVYIRTTIFISKGFMWKIIRNVRWCDSLKNNILEQKCVGKLSILRRGLLKKHSKKRKNSGNTTNLISPFFLYIYRYSREEFHNLVHRLWKIIIADA